MRKGLFGICAAALFAIPTVAFGAVRVGPSHHGYYNRYEGLYDRYESERCRMLRPSCTHKQELGEQNIGNCRKFRELCD